MTKEAELKVAKCMTCRHFSRIATSENQGLCKENSPQVTVVLLPQQNPFNGEVSMNPVPIGAFPTIREDDWCGKHQMKWAIASN